MRRTWATAVLLSVALGCGGRSALEIFAAPDSAGGAGVGTTSVAGAGGTTLPAAGGEHATGGKQSASTGGSGSAGEDSSCTVANVDATPAPDSLDVPTSASIRLAWDCADGSDGRRVDFVLRLSAQGQTVAGESRRGAAPRSLDFVPQSALGLATRYVAELRRGSKTLYQWSFTTVDGDWHEPEPVTVLKGTDQNFAFAVNADGAGIIAYSEEDGGTNETVVTTRRFDVGTGLAEQTQNVAGARYSDVHALSVAVDEQRSAAVAWLEYTGQYAVVAATQTEGAAWQPLRTLTGPNDFWVELEALATNPKGEPFVLWKESISGSGELRLADLAEPNTSPTTVAEAGSGAGAELALEQGGGVWVLWDSPSVSVRHRSNADSWDEPRTFGTASRSGARLAASAAGSALLIFPAKIADRYTLATRHFTADRAWSALGPLDTEGELGTSEATNPALAMDALGNALALWTTSMTYVTSQEGGSTSYATSYELRSQRFDAANGWSMTHDTLDLGQTSERALVLDDAGNGFAVGLAGGEVRAARWLAQLGWQPSILLGSSNGAASPKIVLARGGHAAAIWRDGQSLVIRRFGE